MNVENLGFGINNTKDLAFNLLSSHLAVSEDNTVKSEEFKEILDKFVSNDELKKESLTTNSEKEISGKSNRVVGRTKDDDKSSSELSLEELVEMFSLIKSYLKDNDVFDRVVKDINKVSDLLKSGKVGGESIQLISNLLKDFRNLLEKDLVGGSLKKLISGVIIKVNDLLQNLDKGFVKEGFSLVDQRDKFKLESGKSIEKKFSLIGDKGSINNATRYERYETQDEKIKIFDFRKTLGNSQESAKYSEKLVDIKFGKVSFDSEGSLYNVGNTDGKNFDLMANQRIVRERNLSQRNVHNTFLKYPDYSFRKSSIDEVSMVNKNVEFTGLNYTYVDFGRRSEVENFNNSRLTSVFGYFKLDLISQLNQVAGTMVLNLRNNVNEMKMTLFPPELGKVFVKFESTKDGQIVGNIVVSTREAFTLFEEHLSNIKEVLQNQGFQFVDINLSMNNGEFNEKESFDYVFGEGNIKVTSRKVEDNYNDAYLRYPDSSLEDSTISLYA